MTETEQNYWMPCSQRKLGTEHGSRGGKTDIIWVRLVCSWIQLSVTETEQNYWMPCSQRKLGTEHGSRGSRAHRFCIRSARASWECLCLSKAPGRRLGLEEARFYAAGVALALEYLHTRGVIYRCLPSAASSSTPPCMPTFW